MDTLRVRTYNVHFGDAILVSVPDRAPGPGGKTQTRHILIDVGKRRSKREGPDFDDRTLFAPVLANVKAELGKQPLDLYVMTHEHMDHVRGLGLLDDEPDNPKSPNRLKVRHAWLTASADPKYKERVPGAKDLEKKKELALGKIESFLAAPGRMTPELSTLLEINSSATRAFVDYLARLPSAKPHYVHRGVSLKGTHPFREATLDIWAPERETPVYYVRPQAFSLDLDGGHQDGSGRQVVTPLPPAGVDAGGFYDLVDARRDGFVDTLFAIDKAANNTSVVFCLEWRGWRLLFTGDAEEKSWRMMRDKGVLRPVHFLKVSHHGSKTGRPPDGIIEDIFPGTARVDPVDQRPRTAVLCVYPGAFESIPDAETQKELRARARLLSTETWTEPFRDVLLHEDGTASYP